MDKLKHYLRENRAALDVEIPPANLWQPIQVQLVARAAKAMLIKYIIAIGVLAAAGTGAWLRFHKQTTTHSTPPATLPVAPSKEVIQKDTVPERSAQPVPAIKAKKKKAQQPPSPPVIHKHKKRVDTIIQPSPPRVKKKRDTVNRSTPLRIKKRATPPVT